MPSTRRSDNASFWSERYPALMGRLALPLLVAMAISPFLGGVAFQIGGADWTFAMLTGLAILNIILAAALKLSLPAQPIGKEIR